MTTPEITFCLMDLEGGIRASRGADTSVYGASTVKLGVLLAVVRSIEAGELAWDRQLISRHRFASGISGAGEFGFVPHEIDHGMPPDGMPLSLRAAVRRMIVASSNEATNMLTELVGLEAVNEAFLRVGAAGAGMHRLIGDYAARKAGFSHDVTPRALATAMAAIASGRAAGEQSTAAMMEMLRHQQYPVIAGELSPSRDWGSKSGWVDGIEHDVAFVGPKDAGDRGVSLAVCTVGFGPAEGKAAIRAVARALLA